MYEYLELVVPSSSHAHLGMISIVDSMLRAFLNLHEVKISEA